MKSSEPMTFGPPFALQAVTRIEAKIRSAGCGSCHTIPGIREAAGKVGPPLTAFALRIYIAGLVPNTPSNLLHWIKHPHEIEQHTAMPEMGVTDADSKDIAAYLYTLR